MGLATNSLLTFYKTKKEDFARAPLTTYSHAFLNSWAAQQVSVTIEFMAGSDLATWCLVESIHIPKAEPYDSLP